jgi:hypothetical protein
MKDFISQASDADLLDKSRQFLQAITDTPETYGLTAAQVTDLTTYVDGFEQTLTNRINAQSAAKSATEAKNDDRRMVRTTLRRYLRIAKAHPTTSKAQIASLGIPKGIADPLPTATVPVGSVDTSRRLRHRITFADASAPESRRRPRGTLGCEIWIKVGDDPPTDIGECRYLTFTEKSVHTAEYTGADAGKMVHYIFRWKTKTGMSPISDTVSATVTG